MYVHCCRNKNVAVSNNIEKTSVIYSPPMAVEAHDPLDGKTGDNACKTRQVRADRILYNTNLHFEVFFDELDQIQMW